MTVIIGIDPHKATHMAVAIDGEECAIARLEVVADRMSSPFVDECGEERVEGDAGDAGLGV